LSDFVHDHAAGPSTNVLSVRSARVLAWAGILAIVALSLVPGALRPHTMFSGQIEHFTAYAGTGFFLSLGYLERKQRLLGWIGLAIASGLFETLQHIMPNRSPSLFDALASTCGSTLGLVAGVVVGHFQIGPMIRTSAHRSMISISRRSKRRSATS
jgi:VanZ family protein